MAASYPSRVARTESLERLGRPEAGPMGRIRDERESFGELIGELAEESANLVRDEISLAKHEIKEKAKAYQAATLLLATGGVVGLLSVLALGTAFIIWLGQYIGFWPAAALTGLFLGAVAAGFLLVGKKRLSQLSPKLEETTKTLEENKEWLKDLT